MHVDFLTDFFPVNDSITDLDKLCKDEPLVNLNDGN